jgi:hypothetical protein
MPRGAKPGESKGPLAAALRGDVLFRPFEKQEKFIQAALSGQFKFMAYGGSIRSGKTYESLALLILLCKLYPGSRWAVIRQDLPKIRRNVLPVFEKLRPTRFIAPVNKTTWTATCTNGSEILFVPESYRDDPDGTKWRGFEINGAVLEEGNELKEQTFDAMIERAGTWTLANGQRKPPTLIIITCNPSQGWVKERFHDPYVAHQLRAPYFFMQALPTDNPYIDDEQKEQWKNLPDHLYKRYILGDWSISDDPRQIIPYEPLHQRLIFDPTEIEGATGIECLGVDYGGQGRDLTALAHMRDALLYEIATHYRLTQPAVGSIIRTLMVDRGINGDRIGIDAVGEGSGLWGDLHESDIPAMRIMAGSAPMDIAMSQAERSMQLQYRNLKAQMWWLMRRDILEDTSDLRIINDSALIQDLTSVWYKITNEKIIQVEAKDDTKRRIGRSPDRGDAAVIANLIRHAPAALTGFILPEGDSALTASEAELARSVLGRFTGNDIEYDIDSIWNS